VGKILLAILLAVALVVIPVSSAFAAKTAGVSITAKPGYISISNAPGSWDFGVVTQGTDNQTANSYFTITNTSKVMTDIEIKADNWTGGWAYANPVGVDTAYFIASNDNGWGGGPSGGTGKFDREITLAETVFCNNLPADTNVTWELKLKAPTDFDVTADQSTTITLRAHLYS